MRYDIANEIILVKGREEMFETKALLRGQAEYALAVKDRVMYQYVCKQLNVEGLVLLPYDEAIKEMEAEKDA